MIYGVPANNLREYSQDNKKYGFVNLPDDEYRLRGEEISGSEEEKAEDHDAQMSQLFDNALADDGKP